MRALQARLSFKACPSARAGWGPVNIENRGERGGASPACTKRSVGRWGYPFSRQIFGVYGETGGFRSYERRSACPNPECKSDSHPNGPRLIHEHDHEAKMRARLGKRDGGGSIESGSDVELAWVEAEGRSYGAVPKGICRAAKRGNKADFACTNTKPSFVNRVRTNLVPRNTIFMCSIRSQIAQCKHWTNEKPI